MPGGGRDRPGERESWLQLGRERSDESHTGGMEELADLLKTDLHFAARDDGGHGFAGWRPAYFSTLARDLIRYPELREQRRRQIRAAAAVRVADGHRGKQRPAQRRDAADVGRPGAVAHHHADLRQRELHR